MVLASGATWLLAGRLDRPQAMTTFWLALLLLPLFGLTGMRLACLAGLQRIVLGQVPELVVRPALFLVLVSGALLLGRGSLMPEAAMALQLIAVGCACVSGTVWLYRRLPPQTRHAVPVYDTRAWIGGALPFLLAGGLQLINGQTDLIMLGWFATAADVGVYRVVGLGAGSVLFVYAAVHGTLAPTIARLYAEGNIARLQNVVTRTARALLLVALPVCLVLAFFGKPILSGVFGPEYAAGTIALAILATGQLIYTGTALGALLLDMTGHQRDTTRIVAVSAISNAALNAVLIPALGVDGAALASATSLMVFGTMSVAAARRRLGLHVIAFGRSQRAGFGRNLPAAAVDDAA